MTPVGASPPSAAAPGHVPLAAKVAWLSDAAAYADRPRTVEVIQTHFAYVFLAGSHAYKLKKPVKVYGADLRPLAERERCCREELRLNSRLAHQTYLGVVPLVVRDGQLAFEGPGVVVDWLVAMRRLDRVQMLDARLRAGSVAPADLEAVVRALRALDTGVQPDRRAHVAPGEHLAGIVGRLDEALREIARPDFGLPRPTYAALAAALRARYADVRPLLAERAWRVREGHGDLRAEHVWLGHPLQIIDALEFDVRLRMLDPAEDVAMLAVDTERLGGAWTRRALCASYETVAGDGVPAPLWHFLLALRAATRAKVALWHLDDPEHAMDPGHWRAHAGEYLALSAQFLAGA
jgi:aminoglycoside phosphotransferase family enzyme